MVSEKPGTDSTKHDVIDASHVIDHVINPRGPCFDKDEVSHWKSVAEEYMKKLQDTKEEFDEYQDESRELEAELEMQLEQYEQKVTELLQLKTDLEDENDKLKKKLESSERQNYVTTVKLQEEVLVLRTSQDEKNNYIRQLEQLNDDLERTKRATITSLSEFEGRLNNAIERNVLLENELEEKEQLMVTVQRLKDESKELKEELAISLQGKNLSKINKSQSNGNDVNNSPSHRTTPTITTTNNSAAPIYGGECKVKHVHEVNMMIKNNVLVKKCAQEKNNNVNNIDHNNNNGIINKHMKIKNDGTEMAEKNNVNGSIEILGSTIAAMAKNGNLPSSRLSALNIVGDILQKVGAMESKLLRYRNLIQEGSRILNP